MRIRRLATLLWASTALLVLFLLVKSFVAEVYRVDSGSMRPTLFGGRDRADGVEDAEHVLVLYGRGFAPERFDLVVVESPDGTKPLVKRVCGIPGDQDFRIRGGDLFVDRKRLPPDAPRPAPVPVYDDRYLAPERFFEFRRDGSVHREGDEWIVQGGEPAPGSMLLYHPELRDDYFDREHRLVTGVVEVNDAVLELEFSLDAPLAAQKLRFQLVEEGDTFEVLLAVGPDGKGKLRLLRRNSRTLQQSPPGEIPLAEQAIELAPGRRYALAFSNIDNTLRVRAPGLGVDLMRGYAENEPWPGSLPFGHSLGSRVRFGIEAGRARFRAVRILRDLYYTDDGTFGTRPRGSLEEPEREASTVSLGPEDYFLLGDNSAASTDSRHFGPIQAERFIGRPLAVVWPDPHWLAAAGAP